MAGTKDIFDYAMNSNSAWAGYKSHQNPDFFPKLAQGQSPQILWIGCADSRCPETTILGLQPGDVFVHRNIANIVSPTDVNTSAVIEYAVQHLKVKYVVLAGHTCCGGCAAALGDSRVGGVLDTWLTPLKAIRTARQHELDAIPESKDRIVRMAELNVAAGARVLLANHAIQDAIRDRGLQVKGVVFDLATGRLRDLGVGDAGEDAVRADGNTVRGKHAMLVFRGSTSAMKAA